MDVLRSPNATPAAIDSANGCERESVFHRSYPALLTGCLLRTANRGVPPCLSQIVLLDVAILRLRRSIRDKPSGYLRFAALATKPGEESGLFLISIDHLIRYRILVDLEKGDRDIRAENR
jgi:hypothetical protein